MTEVREPVSTHRAKIITIDTRAQQDGQLAELGRQHSGGSVEVASSGIISLVDFTATDDDPHGYSKLRSAVDLFAHELDRLNAPQLAKRLRDSQQFVGTPSEWMGETALALNDVLASPVPPEQLRRDIASTVDAIRVGFRRVGSEPNF